jgi:hypothetical protein
MSLPDPVSVACSSCTAPAATAMVFPRATGLQPEIGTADTRGPSGRIVVTRCVSPAITNGTCGGQSRPSLSFIPRNQSPPGVHYPSHSRPSLQYSCRANAAGRELARSALHRIEFRTFVSRSGSKVEQALRTSNRPA